MPKSPCQTCQFALELGPQALLDLSDLFDAEIELLVLVTEVAVELAQIHAVTLSFIS